ncbi:DUF6011 domain-containing protein [Streptomyces chilikensis]|uniref:DUF6011 domain-containing protein n=1 Tax=Streptomyces chilikensis TaxID=1194079 RepID=A0ABV3ERE8_9ACTN
MDTVTTGQVPLLPPPPGDRPRVVLCRNPHCRRELTDPVSRLRGWGPECDREYRMAHQRRDVDQDPLPGM